MAETVAEPEFSATQAMLGNRSCVIKATHLGKHLGQLDLVLRGGKWTVGAEGLALLLKLVAAAR